MLILDGNEVAKQRRLKLKAAIAELRATGAPAPGLGVILVGEDPVSQVYVRNKIKACHDVGIESFHFEMPKNTSQVELKAKLAQLSDGKKVDGILVQLPLPAHLSS